MHVDRSHLPFLGRSPFANGAGMAKGAGNEVRRMSEADARRKPMVPGQERVQIREGVFADISAPGSGGNMGEVVYNKMMSGEPLSDEELAWLRDNNPVEYQKALIIKMEREQYQKELENCRSKEEVRELKERKAQQFVAEASKISGSSMDKSSKVDAMKFLGMRHAAIEYDHKEFVDSARYKALPEKRKKDDPPVISEVDDAKKKALEAEMKRLEAKRKEAQQARLGAAQEGHTGRAEKPGKFGAQAEQAHAGADIPPAPGALATQAIAPVPDADMPQAGTPVAVIPNRATVQAPMPEEGASLPTAVPSTVPSATAPELPSLLLWA